MPLTYDNITSITQHAYVPTMVDNVLDSNTVFQEIKNSNNYKPWNGGDVINQPLFFAKNSSGLWYDRDDPLNTTMPTLNTAASYGWAHYDIPVVIAFTDTIKNAGDPRILSLVAIAMEATEASAADDLGTGVFSDGTTIPKSIVGLKYAVATNSSSLGGISQVTYTWWAAQVDSTTAFLTMPAIRTQINAATIGKKRPTKLIGDRNMFERCIDLLAPQQRYANADTGANAGFESIKVMGIPFVVDSHCQSTNLYGVNFDYTKLYYSPDDNFKLQPFQQPINQRVLLARLGWSGALVYSNPRMNFLLSNISA